MPHRLTTVVLAAGASRRMGSPKLFLPLHGSTLLRLAVAAALGVSPRTGVVVVSGAYDRAIRDHLTGLVSPTRLTIVHNPDWDEGIASSLAVGIRAARAFSPTHYLITLADQPTMGAESLGALVRASLHHPDRIVATHYPERKGVPAVFPAAFTEELLNPTGKFGARRLIALEGERVRVVTFEQPPRDVDTPEDYERLL